MFTMFHRNWARFVNFILGTGVIFFMAVSISKLLLVSELTQFSPKKGSSIEARSIVQNYFISFFHYSSMVEDLGSTREAVTS